MNEEAHPPPLIYIRETEVATMLGLSTKTLRNWRTLGVGPPFCRLGRAVRYNRSDVVAWAEIRRGNSTAELDQRPDIGG